MKTNHIISLLIVLMFTFSACREITVTTKVHADGSFTRTITVTGDSSDLFKKGLPYPIDASWQMAVQRDSVDSALFVTYTKTYQNIDQLSNELRADTSWRKDLKREININKRFGFFYSYLSFDEEVKATNPFTFLDVDEYLSEEDLMWLNNAKMPRSAADTSIMEEVEDKAMDFLVHSITAELVDVIGKGIVVLGDPEITPSVLQVYSDSIFKMVNDWAFDNPDLLIDTLSAWMDNEKLLKLKEMEPDLFSGFNSKVARFNRLIEMEEYNQIVEMPGLITETNSLVLKGNQVSWKVQPLAFLLTDFKMHVESRVINYWIFVVAGALLLLLIAILVLKVFK